MSGTTISVLEPTQYNFNDLISNGYVIIPAAQNIDVSSYTSGALLVRIHETGLVGDASVEVKVQQVLPSPNDPAQFFEGNIIGTVPVTSSDPAGRMISRRSPSRWARTSRSSSPACRASTPVPTSAR